MIVANSRFAAFCLVCFLFGSAIAAVHVTAAEPSVSTIRSVIDKHLRSNVNYRPNDLISRREVEPIFNELLDLGLKTAGDIEEMYDSFLPENHHLVKTLDTSEGTKFMRQIGSLPGAYDRLERLTWVPDGRDLLDQLIVHPQGAQKFKELISPEGIKMIEQRLSSDPRSRNFGLPTGHVYTAEQLLSHLKRQNPPPSRKTAKSER